VTRSELNANIYAFVAAVLVGASVVAVRVAVREIPPLTLAILRFGQGGLVLLIALCLVARSSLRIGKSSVTACARARPGDRARNPSRSIWRCGKFSLDLCPHAFVPDPGSGIRKPEPYGSNPARCNAFGRKTDRHVSRGAWRCSHGGIAREYTPEKIV